MINLDTKIGVDPRLPNNPAPTSTYLERLHWRLTDVLREHAQAINGQDVWEDVVVPATVMRAPGTTPATFNDDTLTWDFSSTTNNVMAFVMQIPHSWAEGTALNFHMHVYLVTAPSTNNTSRWKMDWVLYSPVGDTIPDLTVPANWNTQNYTHTHRAAARDSDIIAFPAVTATGKTASSIFKVKVTRLPTDGADIVSQVVKLDSADAHYQRNTSGSRTEYLK